MDRAAGNRKKDQTEFAGVLKSNCTSSPSQFDLLLGCFGRLSLLALVMLVIFSQSSHAQARRANSNTATAVLHIQVTVVPTAFSPTNTAPTDSLKSVNYRLPNQSGLDVIEESQLVAQTMYMASLETRTGTPPVLKRTTVVPR
jgi:hypothetical protein